MVSFKYPYSFKLNGVTCCPPAIVPITNGITFTAQAQARKEAVVILRLRQVGHWLRSNVRLLPIKESSGAEMVEFVVSLPLIIVTVVGVFDFGSAFVVRQRVSQRCSSGSAGCVEPADQ